MFKVKPTALTLYLLQSMARHLLRGSLGFKRAWEVGARPTVSPERLSQFLSDQRRYAPTLRGLRLDMSGSTTEELRDSKWNKAVVSALAKAAEQIVSNNEDGRFGDEEIDFKKLYRDRFQKLHQEIIEYKAKPGESREKREGRLGERLFHRQKASQRTNIRHVVSGIALLSWSGAHTFLH